MAETLISRREVEALLFNVSDLVALLSTVVEYLGGEDGEEGSED
jgi:hypothetical protein